MKNKKKVVVIGGGFAGSTIARKLEGDFDVTLIDNKEYFEFTPSILRVIVEPKHLKKIQVLHKDYLKKSKIILGEVKSINLKEVLVNKKKIPFDYLALCSGSRYSSPIKANHAIIPSRAKTLFQASKNLEKATKILIIGGGLVGIELAGEICEKYPDKLITLVHASPEILERHNKKTRKYVINYLVNKKVQVRTNQRIVKWSKNSYFTDKGEKIQADMAFFCTGIIPNTEYLKENTLKIPSINENKIEVNSFLQVSKYQNIFSAGDVNNIPVEKTAQNAEQQANIIYKNIRSLEKNKPLIEYHNRKNPVVISLGKRKGVLEYNNIVITGFIPSILKWFIEKKEMSKYK